MKDPRPRWLDLWGRSERVRFLAVGAFNTAFGYVCFAALFLAFGSRWPLFLIQIIAHLLSVISAFLWHRRVTFRSRSLWLPEFLRFNLSYVGTLAFGLAALPLLVRGLHVSPLWGAAILTVLTTIASYLLHRRFSFRVPRSE